MKRSLVLHILITIIFAASLVTSGLFIADVIAEKNAAMEAAAAAAAEATAETTEPEQKPDSITIAVYPYVSNMELFKKVLTEVWAEVEPDIELQYVEWNCYSDPCPNNIDVITYDALFMEHLAESGYIQTLDVESVGNTLGIIPFAMEGARYNGDIYGLPFLVCSSFLMHDKDDEEMAKVENFTDLCKELTTRRAKDPDDGLMAGYNDELPFFFLDAYIDYTGTYTTYTEMPQMYPPEATVLNRLKEIKALLATVPEDMNYKTGFAAGHGSACYAYSEALYFMGDAVDDLTIRSISFFEGENIQMFYADLASLCTQVTDPVKKEYCMKLINLIASEEFQSRLVFGTGDVQYMLPARESVYLAAMEEYPIYEVLHELATDENNRVFRFGPQIHQYQSVAGISLY